MEESTTTPDEVTIRPLTEADLPTLRGSSRAAVSDMRNRLGLSPLPPPSPPDPSAGPSIGEAIVRQLLRLDGAGAWVAAVDGEVVGAALAGVREQLWYLAQFHLLPGYQGRGIGRRLLERALDYGAGATGRLLRSSMDPQAMRTYQRAGFALQPTLDATGAIRRSALPSSTDVRAGVSGDLDLAAHVDRLQRGSAHGPDLELLFAAGARLLIVDVGRRRGYALIDTTPRIVAATDEPTARALLWTALAESSADEVSVAVLRADQQWAIDVAVQAGLRPAPGGPLCSMGSTGPMSPYLPHTGVL